MERDLTPDGLRIFSNIFAYDEMVRNSTKERVVGKTPPPRPPKLTKEEQELDNIRMELCKMINNSQLVIEDCDKILAEIKTKEEYMKSDAKVAKTLHEGLITKLTRVLSGLPAFENEDHLTLNVNNLSQQIRGIKASR